MKLTLIGVVVAATGMAMYVHAGVFWSGMAIYLIVAGALMQQDGIKESKS